MNKNQRKKIEEKMHQIRQFFVAEADPAIVKKYARYFKEGFDGYGIDQKAFEKQRDQWIEDWKEDMTLADYLDLGDALFQQGRYEEKSLAIVLVQSQRAHFSPTAFKRIGRWFTYGITDWATTDVLCMLVLSGFLLDKVIDFEDLKEWGKSESEWQRRAVPVTLVELIKHDLKPKEALPIIEPLMLDESEYVQKGIGTLLRGLWKKHPHEIEGFLLQWKDHCGRILVRYAVEKMDKESRKRFRKSKL